jgi:AraC family transcriptional regulator of arabinose operon
MQLSAGAQSFKKNHAFTREREFPYWTLGLFVSGRAFFKTAHGESTLTAVQAGLVPPGVPYHVRVDGSRFWSEQWIIFHARPGWQRWLRWPEHLSGMMHLSLTDSRAVKNVSNAFAEVLRLSRSILPEAEAFSFNALEKLLLICNTLNPIAPGEQLDARVRAAADFIATHSARPLTVAAIAQAVHLSPSHLAHIFTAQMGVSPMRFLENQRLRRAQELLVSTLLPIRDVAREVGFENPYHFSTRFSKYIGKSPRHYRRQPKL